METIFIEVEGRDLYSIEVPKVTIMNEYLLDKIINEMGYCYKGARIEGFDEYIVPGKTYKMTLSEMQKNILKVEALGIRANTPLIYVIDRDIMDLLIKIYPNAINELPDEFDATTPMHQAVDENNVSNLKYFLRKGGDLEAEDNNGYPPIYTCIMKNNFDCFKILADEAARREEDSLLSWVFTEAVTHNRLDMVKYLIGVGCEIEVEDLYKSVSNSFEMFKIILESYPDLDINSEQRDDSYYYPFFETAMEHDDLDIADLLIEFGIRFVSNDDESLKKYIKRSKKLGRPPTSRHMEILQRLKEKNLYNNNWFDNLMSYF